MTHPSSPPDPLDTACPGPASRRAFLREAASLLACATSLGLTPGLDLGFAIARRPALRVVGDEAVYPLPPTDGATIDRDHAVILVRHQDRTGAHTGNEVPCGSVVLDRSYNFIKERRSALRAKLSGGSKNH